MSDCQCHKQIADMSTKIYMSVGFYVPAKKNKVFLFYLIHITPSPFGHDYHH